MIQEIISARLDREIKKKIIVFGDYSVVPYEDSKCKIVLSNVVCENQNGDCEVEAESRILSKTFDGIVLIGDTDSFIDKDIELILQQMCCGETCEAKITYNDSEGKLVKWISCQIELREVTEEQLISDWRWERLFESATYHKECGVKLVKDNKIADAFRRFNKSLKMLIAIEPIDPEVIDEKSQNEIFELKAKVYNNLAHCQLQYNEYEAAIELCNRVLKLDPNNVKSLYRRCVAYSGIELYEQAWTDIQHVLQLNPKDKTAQQRANDLKPKIDKINEDYAKVMKKMFAKCS